MSAYPETPEQYDEQEWNDETGLDTELLELMDDEGEWLDEEDENFR